MTGLNAEQLKELLDGYDEAYYNLDSPIISDQEYDSLKQRYLNMILGVETVVGGIADRRFKKVPHTTPILSLEKVKDKGTLLKKMEEFQSGAIQPKLDGLTIVVYGENTLRDFPIWSTRGSGTEGEDVSETASKIPGLRPIPNIAYRAEIVMLKADFEKLNKERIANGEEPFANPRNAAAGMIRQSDSSKVRGLTYYAYNIIDSELSEEKQIELLKLAGINTVPTKFYVDTLVSRDNALKWIVGFTKEQQEALPYEIDGMVIKSNIPNSLNVFGSTGHHPKNAVAYKYPTESKWTTLRDVVWQLGKNGQVTPVAVFDEVELFGTMVSRATLHNWDYILALSLAKNLEIAVTKANMIIPKVIDSRYPENTTNAKLTALKPPYYCPVCGGTLHMEGANIMCNNINCQGMIIAQVNHLADKDALDIDGLSTKTITKLFDRGWLNRKFDIFNITVDQLETLEGFARPSAQKLYDNIQNARKNVPFHKFLYACGIPLLGRTASKDIAKHFGAEKDPLDALIVDILLQSSARLDSIPGIGATIINSIKDNVETFNLLKQKVTISYNGLAKASKPKQALTFVITGALYRGTRDAYKEKIELLGHKLSGSVSKKTDYLVTNETTSTTKRQKAEELGVPIIDEEEMIKLLA